MLLNSFSLSAQDHSKTKKHTASIHYDGDGFFSSNEIEKALVDVLLKDGVITNKQNYNIHFTNDYLKVNGKKLSANNFKKYKAHTESIMGHSLGDSFEMQIDKNESSSNSMSISSGGEDFDFHQNTRGQIIKIEDTDMNGNINFSINQDDDKTSLYVKKNGKKVYSWKGEGEVPNEVKEKLKEYGIQMGQY